KNRDKQKEIRKLAREWAEHRAKVQATGQAAAKQRNRGGRPRDPETEAIAAVIVSARQRQIPRVSWSKMPDFVRNKTGRTLSLGACRSLYDQYRTPALQPRDAATSA